MSGAPSAGLPAIFWFVAYDTLRSPDSPLSRIWLAAFSVLFKHLAPHGEVTRNVGHYVCVMFRSLYNNNRVRLDRRRHMHPDAVDRIVRKFARRIGLDGSYSAHSTRATFITTALNNGPSLEDVQRAAGSPSSPAL